MTKTNENDHTFAQLRKEAVQKGIKNATKLRKQDLQERLNRRTKIYSTKGRAVVS